MRVAKHADRRIARQFASFTAVGALGFAVDATLFVLLSSQYLWPVWAARAVSASSAIATTWSLNRQLTFSARKSPRAAAELLRYSLVQFGGLVVNLGVFAAALLAAPPLRSLPVVALALGAGCALLFNFVSARRFAFRGRA